MQKHLLRVLGLSLLAVVGLMAFASAGAQAAGEVTVLGAAASLSPAQQFTGEQEGEGKLLVPNLKIEIRCPDFEVLSGKLLAKGEALAEILFLGCTAWGLNAAKTALILLTECHILDGVAPNKEGHITAKTIVTVDLVTGTKKTLLVGKPDGQTFFAKFKLTTGLGCLLTSPIEIKGTAGFAVTEGNLQTGTEVKEVLIESNEAIQKLHGKLEYGSNESFIDGSAKLKLTVTNVGCTWGII